MDIAILERFFFWCMIINIGVYTITVLAALGLRNFVCEMQAKMFGVSEETVKIALYLYIAGYKLLLGIFIFIPWIALLIIS